MARIPGLDVLNVSGDEPPNIFDDSFRMPANLGNMRTEGDFNYTTKHKLKAPIFFCKGKDEPNLKEVSLVIYNETQDPDDELTDILHEVEIITDLDHDNILRFYETIAGTKITDVALVFEAHKSLLSEIIAEEIKELYEPSVIKYIMRELFTGLDYLHQNGIIHRDIQPENIVFTSTGVLKIWNFRNARRVGQKPKKLKVNEFRYQCVELLFESENYDETVDIWSANCIFFQLWLKKTFCIEHGREKVLQGIFMLLGFPKRETWEEFYSFPGISDLTDFEKFTKYNLIDTYLKKCRDSSDHPVPKHALHLLHRCFRYNPIYRPKTDYCLLHPYFSDEPRACPAQKIVELLDEATICGQLRAIKNKKSV